MTEEYRPVIVVAASSQGEARRYVEALAPFEAELVVVTPGAASTRRWPAWTGCC